MVTASPLRNKSLTSVSRDDLLQAAKAIHDEARTTLLRELEGIKSLLTGQVGEVKALMESRFSDIETEALRRFGKGIDSHVGKALNDAVSKQTDLLETHYQKRLDVIQKSHEEYMGRVAVLEGVTEKRLEVMEKTYTEKASFMQESYKASMQRLELLLSNLQIQPPPINVNVPQQLPAEVTVNIPEAVVNVTVPEQSVTVNVPQQQPPNVEVNVPPPRLTEKRFTYDDVGRPDTIREQEISEDSK